MGCVVSYSNITKSFSFRITRLKRIRFNKNPEIFVKTKFDKIKFLAKRIHSEKKKVLKARQLKAITKITPH